MDATIRRGEPRDVEAVLRLMMELAEHEGLSQFVELTREGLHRFCFEQPRRIELIVAEAGSVIVGYATCLVQFSPWLGREYLFLDDLYVSDEARGTGIGSRLLRDVGALALERGVGVRWHVEPANRSAQQFYRRFGAELRDKWIAYWPLEAIREQLGVTHPSVP
jgi:GNAT superfamily N-acetyltransferase